MKKFTKILSLVLALTLVASLFTVNVMAASKAHTMTLAADKTTGLKAGDTVIVTVSLDNTADIKSLGYYFVFDSEAFEIDRTKGWESEETYDMVENFISQDWFDSMQGSVWKKKLSTFKYGYDDPAVGYITMGWTGDPVPATKVEDDYMLGKFILKVKNDVADGEYEVKLDLENSSTTDNGENFGTPMVSAPLKLTVGSGAPTPATPSVNTEFGTATAAGIAANRGGVEFVYDNAYAVTVKMSNTNEATKAGIQFIPALVLATNGNSWDDAAEAVFTTGLGAGEAEFTAALINIPRKFAGQTIKMMARGFVVVGENTITGKEVEKDITYTVTAEPGQN